MNRLEFTILAIVTAVMLSLTVVTYNARHHAGDQEYLGTSWLGDFDVNAVTRMDVVGPGDMPQVSLERRPEGWGVVQRDHYEADVGMIRSLLLDLTEAKLLERKTSDPAQHAQLGLGDIARSQARGQKIVLHAGGQSRSVRVGATPSGRSATYVRSVGEDQSWLVDRTFTIPAEPRRWLEPDLLDIGMEQVRRMKVTHPDGETIEGRRAGEGEDVKFAALNLPPGAKLKSEYALNRMASAITSLSLEDVMPASQAESYLEQAALAEYELDDGASLAARLFSVGAERYARFAVRLEEGMDAERRVEAELLARHLERWAFRIPSFAHASMALRWADITEPPEGE